MKGMVVSLVGALLAAAGIAIGVGNYDGWETAFLAVQILAAVALVVCAIGFWTISRDAARAATFAKNMETGDFAAAARHGAAAVQRTAADGAWPTEPTPLDDRDVYAITRVPDRRRRGRK